MVDRVKEMRVGLSRALLHEARNFQHLSFRFKENRDMSAGELDTIEQKVKQFESSLCTKYLSSKPVNPIGFATEMKKKTESINSRITYFKRVKEFRVMYYSTLSNFQEGCKELSSRNPPNKLYIDCYISRNDAELAILDHPQSMSVPSQDPWVRLRSLQAYLQYVQDYGVAILSDWEFRISLRDVLEQNPPVRSPMEPIAVAATQPQRSRAAAQPRRNISRYVGKALFHRLIVPVSIECCICLEPLDHNCIAATLPCGHMIHQTCCRKLRRSIKCPLCQAPFKMARMRVLN